MDYLLVPIIFWHRLSFDDVLVCKEDDAEPRNTDHLEELQQLAQERVRRWAQHGVPVLRWNQTD